MNVLDAVERALAEAGAPLPYRDITRRVLDADLWQTNGLTPEATINAQLSMDIVNRGTASRFQRTAKGVFALRVWGLPEYSGTLHHNGSAHRPGTVEPGAEPSPADTLSFVNAAEQVLELVGGGKPMHYRDITQKALELGLLETAGKTPEATLYAAVLNEISRQSRRGETPRFVKQGKGVIGLARRQTRGLAFEIDQHNAEVRRQLLERLKAMPPNEFEALIGKLLAAIGFEEIEVTSYAGDGGIDVRGTLVVGDVIRTRMAVQVKRWQQNIQTPIVQQVRGALGTHEQGLIITTSDFSSGAQTEAERPNAVPVGLMNGEQLVALLIEYDIGVHRTTHDLIELGEVETN